MTEVTNRRRTPTMQRLLDELAQPPVEGTVWHRGDNVWSLSRSRHEYSGATVRALWGDGLLEVVGRSRGGRVKAFALTAAGYAAADGATPP